MSPRQQLFIEFAKAALNGLLASKFDDGDVAREAWSISNAMLDTMPDSIRAAIEKDEAEAAYRAWENRVPR